MNKFLNPIRDAAVLPIPNLNGHLDRARIAQQDWALRQRDSDCNNLFTHFGEVVPRRAAMKIEHDMIDPAQKYQQTQIVYSVLVSS